MEMAGRKTGNAGQLLQIERFGELFLHMGADTIYAALIIISGAGA
jgi:hypothetical protein